MTWQSSQLQILTNSGSISASNARWPQKHAPSTFMGMILYLGGRFVKAGMTCYLGLMTNPIHIIGAGMAGSEAAWQAVRAGVSVVLHEMRPAVATEAHRTGGFAELVCSNSFRSDDAEQNAVGLLHWEMRRAGSLIMAMADRHKVPAG